MRLSKALLQQGAINNELPVFTCVFDYLESTNSFLAQHQCVHLKPFCSRELQRAPMDGFTAWLWMNVLVLGFSGAGFGFFGL